MYDIPVGEYAGYQDGCTVLLSSVAGHDMNLLSLFIKCSSHILLQLQNYAWLNCTLWVPLPRIISNFVNYMLLYYV
jgi:hypothetical protein